MPVKPVVVNNTPLVALHVLNRLDLLRELYDEVLVPSAVQNEFLATEQIMRQISLDSAPWIKTVSLANPQRVLVYSGLGRGEAEVLALAEEQSAQLVIIDERKGRRYAQRLGIPVTGTVGVLLLAKEKGLIVALAPLLAELQKAGLYLDSSVITKALSVAGEVPS
jgi:hypothetical protein